LLAIFRNHHRLWKNDATGCNTIQNLPIVNRFLFFLCLCAYAVFSLSSRTGLDQGTFWLLVALSNARRPGLFLPIVKPRDGIIIFRFNAGSVGLKGQSARILAYHLSCLIAGHTQVDSRSVSNVQRICAAAAASRVVTHVIYPNS